MHCTTAYRQEDQEDHQQRVSRDTYCPVQDAITRIYQHKSCSWRTKWRSLETQVLDIQSGAFSLDVIQTHGVTYSCLRGSVVKCANDRTQLKLSERYTTPHSTYACPGIATQVILAWEFQPFFDKHGRVINSLKGTYVEICKPSANVYIPSPPPLPPFLFPLGGAQLGELKAPVWVLVLDVTFLQINNGTYKSGFATTQAAYDKAQAELYDGLELIEQRLSQSRFLLGDK